MAIISYLSTAARLRFSKPAHSYYYLKYATFLDLVERNAKSDSSASPKSVPVQTAYELLKRGHRFLDVRTHDEFLAGHPSGAINIAYMLKVGQEMAKNSEFVKEVSSQFEKDEKLLLGCKSGRRSLLAAKELQSFGFTSVTDVAGGYIAWKESGLPINH